MKNKKLFAILTLVCFMFTLMPVAAFAATTYDADQVYVKANGTTFETEDEATVKVAFSAQVGDGTSTESYIYYAVDEDGAGVALSAAGAGVQSLTINTIGDFSVYAIKTDAATISSVTGAVDTVANKVAKLVAWAESLDLIVAGEAEVSVDAPDMEYRIVLSPYTKDGYTTSFTAGSTATLNIEASDGFVKNGKVIAELQSKVKGAADSTYAAVKAGYVDIAYDTLTTDRKGQVVFEVTADLANTGNKVIVKFGKAKAELTVNASSAGVANVAVNNEAKAPINNTKTILSSNTEFKFTDANGIAAELVYSTAPTATTDGIVNLSASNIAITIVEKPAKSNLKDSDFRLVKQAANATYQIAADTAGVYTLECTDGTGKADKDGTYVIKVAMKNGSSATATVKVAEMGEVVGIMFAKAPKTVAYGEKVNVGAVVAVDANGVTDSTISYDLSASGLAVDQFYTAASGSYVKGDLVAKADEDYVGQTITVMAVYEDFVATTEIAVVDQAATIKFVSNEAEVGINTNLVGRIVDATGKTTTIGTVTEVKAIVLDKPENAVAVANSAIGNALKDGNVVLSFLASAPGEYKVQTIVTYTVGSATKYISGIETVTVGGGVNAFDDVVVLSIGSAAMIVNDKVVALDVAPFIAEGRTMMQYTALSAFGIEFAWDEATRSVVAEGNGVKVVMTIDSKIATVNGKVVEMEVAPTIINGRTVIPVTYATNPFGIVPTCIYNADGSVADVLFTK